MRMFLFKIIRPFIKKKIVQLLNDEKIKTKLVESLNEKIDIPNVDEDKEKLFLNQTYDALGKLTIDIIEEL